MTSTATFSPAVLGWLVDGEARRVLDLGSGQGSLAVPLAERGHRVVCLDHDLFAADRLAARCDRLSADRRATTGSAGLAVIVGQAESLPLIDRAFDVVTAAQTLHHFAPGLALTEIARVLRPGGHLAVAYHTRDDTVPWVKRLARIVQQYDPSLMRGEYGTESVDALAASDHFDDLEHRRFRAWIPVTRPRLVAMVTQSPSVAALDEDVQGELLESVGELYDASARAPEPLLLPWQTTCWRATVNHRGMRFPDPDDGVHIGLGF